MELQQWKENELKGKELLKHYQWLNTVRYSFIVLAVFLTIPAIIGLVESMLGLKDGLVSSISSFDELLYFLAPLSIVTALLGYLNLTPKLKSIQQRYEELTGEKFSKGIAKLY